MGSGAPLTRTAGEAQHSAQHCWPPGRRQPTRRATSAPWAAGARRRTGGRASGTKANAPGSSRAAAQAPVPAGSSQRKGMAGGAEDGAGEPGGGTTGPPGGDENDNDVYHMLLTTNICSLRKVTREIFSNLRACGRRDVEPVERGLRRASDQGGTDGDSTRNRRANGAENAARHKGLRAGACAGTASWLSYSASDTGSDVDLSDSLYG